MLKRLARLSVLSLFFIAFLGLGSAANACGPQGVCGDIFTSLTGQVMGESIVLAWSTNDEDSTVVRYTIRRYTTDPYTSTWVANVTAVSSCNTNHDYSYEDFPDTPLSQWNYFVEVWTANGRACAADVDPQ